MRSLAEIWLTGDAGLPPAEGEWWPSWWPVDLRTGWVWWLVGLLVLLVLLRAGRGVGRWVRRRGPARIHPKLAKYNVDQVEVDKQRRAVAGQIMATSTGAGLAGFRIVRQVDAVFVEGLRTPEEAVTALKAAAAERGANALLNVSTQRTAAGRCSAGGDAVVAVPEKTAPDLQGGSNPKTHSSGEMP